MKILLIEDNEPDAYIIEEAINEATTSGIFENLRLKLTWVDCLASAYEKLNTDDFDLIILDLNLSDSAHTGLETLGEVMSKVPHMPIVVSTGNINAQLWSDAIKMGAQDYIIKGSIDPVNLVRTLSYAMERFALMKQVEKHAARLEISNKELESFAYVASHDLREPLRKIVAFGDRLVEDFYDSLALQGKDYVDRMQSAAHRMENLLDDLLAFSRVSRHKIELKEVNLGKILSIALEDLEMSIQKSKANINLISPLNLSLAKEGVLSPSLDKDLEQLFGIDADEAHLLRAFENLLANAIKYRKPEQAPTINISAILNHNSYEISVEDNGIGFEMEYKDKIFEQFERLHAKSAYEGSGMGLATVKKIIEKHDGSIDVQSKVDVGSNFTIKLPICAKI